jgi:hypothetical protein
MENIKPENIPSLETHTLLQTLKYSEISPNAVESVIAELQKRKLSINEAIAFKQHLIKRGMAVPEPANAPSAYVPLAEAPRSLSQATDTLEYIAYPTDVKPEAVWRKTLIIIAIAGLHKLLFYGLFSFNMAHMGMPFALALGICWDFITVLAAWIGCYFRKPFGWYAAFWITIAHIFEFLPLSLGLAVQRALFTTSGLLTLVGLAIYCYLLLTLFSQANRKFFRVNRWGILATLILFIFVKVMYLVLIYFVSDYF